MTLERGGQLQETPGKDGQGWCAEVPDPEVAEAMSSYLGTTQPTLVCAARSQVCHSCPEDALQESNLFLCSKSLPYECVDRHESPMSTEHPEKEPETLIGVTSGMESLVLWNQDKTFSYGLSRTLSLSLIHLNKHLGKHYLLYV